MSKTTLETLCCITLFTYFGALTRMLLSNLSQTSFNTQLLPDFVSSFFLPNIVGSFIMGVFVPLDKLFSPNYLSWYSGVTTGFCGSCTTFSTWQRVTAQLLAHGHIVDGLMGLLFTFCTSYMALIFGMHVGEAVFHRSVRCWRGQRFGEVAVTVTNTDMSTTQFGLGSSITRCSVYLFIATLIFTASIWIALYIDASSEASVERRIYWMVAALGPIGSLARYFLLLNNRNRPTFPLFTFLMNVCASVISSVIFFVFVRLSLKNGNWLAYDSWFNYGIGAGIILGCFSTVSTFVYELRKLVDTNIFHAYRYGLLSIFVSQVLCIAIVRYFCN